MLGVIGGCLSPYWLPSELTTIANVHQSVSPPISCPTTSIANAKSTKRLNANDAYKRCSVLIANIQAFMHSHPTVLPDVEKNLLELAAAIKAPVNCDVANPERPVNKRGRKRKDRFPNQHDHIAKCARDTNI